MMNNKTAMIWGANGGIGRALTAKLAAEQWNVIAIARKDEDVPGAVATPFWDKVPLRLPKDAASPEKVCAKILEAAQNSVSGTLDLT